MILLDNAIFYKSKEVKTKKEDTKNNYLYSIRYRPNTNPIEGFFNHIKNAKNTGFVLKELDKLK